MSEAHASHHLKAHFLYFSDATVPPSWRVSKLKYSNPDNRQRANSASYLHSHLSLIRSKPLPKIAGRRSNYSPSRNQVILLISKSSPPLFQIPPHASVLPKAARDFEGKTRKSCILRVLSATKNSKSDACGTFAVLSPLN